MQQLFATSLGYDVDSNLFKKIYIYLKITKCASCTTKGIFTIYYCTPIRLLSATVLWQNSLCGISLVLLLWKKFAVYIVGVFNMEMLNISVFHRSKTDLICKLGNGIFWYMLYITLYRILIHSSNITLLYDFTYLQQQQLECYDHIICIIYCKVYRKCTQSEKIKTGQQSKHFLPHLFILHVSYDNCTAVKRYVQYIMQNLYAILCF